MLQNGADSPNEDGPSKMFLGVCFVLLGFDPIEEAKVRSKLVNGGGVDAGEYGPSCTHVIVDKIVYDDSNCVAARSDGKTLVTALWVNHSFDVGMLVDASSILYRPIKDLRGILGAKSLFICSTGYQRQDRDDIMRMVGLMGAHFSKPLVANKVTHLICYKFEGEKYELAKKMKKIKLVNHQWLEDCLKAWEILPECNYNKSGYELEMMEAQAKDSEEETEEDRDTKQSRERNIAGNPFNLQGGSEILTSKVSELPMPIGEVSKIHQHADAFKSLPDITEDIVTNKRLSISPAKQTRSDEAPDLHDVNKKGQEEFDCEGTGAYCRDDISGRVSSPYGKNPNISREGIKSNTRNAKRSPHSDAAKLSTLSYSRKNPRRSPVSIFSEELSARGSLGHSEEDKDKDGFDVLPLKVERAKNNLDFGGIPISRNDSELHHGAGKIGTLAQKRTMVLSIRSPTKGSPSSKARATGTPSANTRPDEVTTGAAKLSTLSYSRKNPRRSPVSMFSEELSSHARGSPQGHSEEDKDKDGFDISPLKVERSKNNLNFGGIQIPRNDSELHHGAGKSGTLAQKRTMVISITSCRSPTKGSPSSKGCTTGSPSTSTRPEGVAIGAPQMNSIPSIRSSSHSMDGISVVNSTENEFASLSETKSLYFNKKSLKRGLPVSRTTISDGIEFPLDIKMLDFTKERTPETSWGGLKQSNLATALDVGDFGMNRSTYLAGKIEEPQKQHQDGEISSPNTRNSGIEQSRSPVNLAVGKGRKNEASSRSLKKRNLSSRPKLSTGSTSKCQGSLYLDKTDTPNEANSCSVEGKDGREHENIFSVKPEMAGPTFKADEVIGEKEKVVQCSANNIENATVCKGDETQAPEGDNDGAELEKAGSEEKVEPTFKLDVALEEKSEGLQHSANGIKRDIECMDGGIMASGEDGGELEKAISGKKAEVGELTSKADAVKEEMSKGRQHPPSKTKKNAVSAVKEIETSGKGKDKVELKNKTNDEKMEMEKEEGVLCPASKPKSKTVYVNKTEKPMDAEKENKPIENGGQSVNSGKRKRAKVAVKSNRTPMQVNEMVDRADLDRMKAGGGSNFVSSEPVWFILSGHHLQRKEFQLVIRRLKGRLCRDSHHWCYQATHSIVPDPVRRTEKFFAAAASGRWILKTDYLTASNQAGRFLEEEPYEWFRNGLSEDGAINLEAPRKWRLLRERTGHGAFYGMRIIIYGECIAPPLDTLKRVVKAGDGTILATSPPYTRFLKSGVDFAVVSPGMPCVDSWVQEFLRHEIPCIVADYLVEYVCKPGYSLERHVLYKTHAWAEKSFANLLSQSKEIVKASSMPSEDGSADLTCQVCASHDRWEMMLICGHENGSVGCGVGTHSDCCDPPIEADPKEDWFCPKCSKMRSRNNPSKSKKKGSSLLKCK